MSTSALEPVTYRRDRLGETWHMVPPGERGNRGRTLCGEPRQWWLLAKQHRAAGRPLGVRPTSPHEQPYSG